jgi:predicted dehydrogenase
MRIGLVGCGKIGWRHLDAYRQLGISELSVYDTDRDAARKLGEEFNAQVADSLNDLLAVPDLTAVDVCVPTPHHYPVVMSALAARKHIFCEKPLAQTPDQVRRIIEAATAGGCLVQVGFLYRFFPAFTQLKELLGHHILGTPHQAILRLGGRGAAAEWKHSTAQGGGAVSEMLVHMLDLAQWLFGAIEEGELLCSATLLPQRTIGRQVVVADAEDYVVVRLRAGSTEILCESDLVTPSFMNYVEVQGENGSVFASSLHYLPMVVYLKGARGIYNQGNTFLNFPMTNTMVEQLKVFVEACRTGQTPINNVSESLRVIEFMDRFKQTVVRS